MRGTIDRIQLRSASSQRAKSIIHSLVVIVIGCHSSTLRKKSSTAQVFVAWLRQWQRSDREVVAFFRR